jgi:hypothetical protein
MKKLMFVALLAAVAMQAHAKELFIRNVTVVNVGLTASPQDYLNTVKALNDSQPDLSSKYEDITGTITIGDHTCLGPTDPNGQTGRIPTMDKIEYTRELADCTAREAIQECAKKGSAALKCAQKVAKDQKGTLDKLNARIAARDEELYAQFSQVIPSLNAALLAGASIDAIQSFDSVLINPPNQNSPIQVIKGKENQRTIKVYLVAPSTEGTKIAQVTISILGNKQALQTEDALTEALNPKNSGSYYPELGLVVNGLMEALTTKKPKTLDTVLGKITINAKELTK